MFEALGVAREIGCLVSVQLAFVVVMLVTVVLAGDIKSKPSPSCAICDLLDPLTNFSRR